MTDANFEPAPVDVWSEEFTSLANSMGLARENCSGEESASSEARAACFVLALLRREASLRYRFPRALSDGETGHFCWWLKSQGAIEYGLSAVALEKITDVFRQESGKTLSDIYFNDPELQKIYPLGLVSVGQRHFLEWLASHGRVDQRLTPEQILWFLYESNQDPARGFCYTYSLQPVWQQCSRRRLHPRAISSASMPLPTPTACRTPHASASAPSKA